MGSSHSPVLAAIDAGSNAIRMMVAQPTSPTEITIWDRDRQAVRLGHHTFTEGIFDTETIDRAVSAFGVFREIMQYTGVEYYRAVGTSACREARNQNKLAGRIKQETGIELKTIEGADEAALVRLAVLGCMPKGIRPGMIVDLGGGSFEFSWLEDAGSSLKQSAVLPLGTVRMMEHLDLQGPLGRIQTKLLREVAQEYFDELESWREVSPESPVVACGGNAEQLAKLFPGPNISRCATLNVHSLKQELPTMLGEGIKGRMKRYGVRQDRAEVMAIAAVLFLEFCHWWNCEALFVPGVGVREGIIAEWLLHRRKNFKRFV